MRDESYIFMSPRGAYTCGYRRSWATVYIHIYMPAQRGKINICSKENCAPQKSLSRWRHSGRPVAPPAGRNAPRQSMSAQPRPNVQTSLRRVARLALRAAVSSG